jgi:hypothetical protein
MALLWAAEPCGIMVVNMRPTVRPTAAIAANNSNERSEVKDNIDEARQVECRCLVACS